MIEPIQGEAGVVVPHDGYLARCAEICRKHRVLLIADEVQTGLGRTGDMLACDHDQVRPDILILGKALSGGMVPASAVLCDDEVMLNIRPGEHGSTYGGNPLACQIAMEALDVLQSENMIENSRKMGELFRQELKALLSYSWIRELRGRGLMNAIDVEPSFPIKAWDLCLKLKDRGLLCKPTHDHIIRFTPPLVINEGQVREGCRLIREVFNEADGEAASRAR
jgi:ornithine--oxo-acid transaminase